MVIDKYLQKITSPAPLSIFRVFFGLMIFGSMLRFASKGWIYDLYIKPKYFFKYYGFEFIQSLGYNTYILFLICGVSAFLVAIGFLYRFAIISLFLSFSYIELLDKSTYLNHYYFISLVCFLLIFLPANVHFSVDSYRSDKITKQFIPQWNIDVLKLTMAILYFYAGLAKVNSEWLLNALPLKIWLPARNDMPIIGFLFNYSWVPYAFSWLACLYDLTIPFLLLQSRTRPFAYLAVIIFHLLTSFLFPIGMFPHIMIVSALIFFSVQFHEKIINILRIIFMIPIQKVKKNSTYQTPQFVKWLFLVFFSFQLLFPFRYLLYKDELFWTEEGYRFSWRVMLIEKAGYSQFTVKDDIGHKVTVNNAQFLTNLQEKMMSTQPDMMLQYAHILRNFYTKNGFANPQVYVDSYVSLNGRLGKPIIDPNTDLAKEKETFYHKNWILPFNETIKGF